MQTLETTLDPNTPRFRENDSHHRALAAELQAKLALVKEGGGTETVAKHRARNKKLPRERIDALLDPGAPFLEFSSLAANGLYGDQAPGAGLVTASAFQPRAVIRCSTCVRSILYAVSPTRSASPKITRLFCKIVRSSLQTFVCEYWIAVSVTGEPVLSPMPNPLGAVVKGPRSARALSKACLILSI